MTIQKQNDTEAGGNLATVSKPLKDRSEIRSSYIMLAGQEDDPHHPLWQAMPIGQGQFDTGDWHGGFERISLYRAITQGPTAFEKNKAPWIIPSTLGTRTHKEQREKGSFVCLTADIDKGDVPLEGLRLTLIDLFGKNQLIRIYSTSSAAHDQKKWRVLIPLNGCVPYSEWNLRQVTLGDYLEKSGIPPDRALERAGQLVFLPNVPKSRRDEKGVPYFYQSELIGDELLSVQSGQESPLFFKLLEKARETEIAKERQRMAIRATRKIITLPQTFTAATVALFNKDHSIDALLAEYGYIGGPGENWKSPLQQSGSYGTKNYGDYWVSLSSSDAEAGLGFKSATGCHGTAFSLYLFYEHGNDLKKAVKELTDD